MLDLIAFVELTAWSLIFWGHYEHNKTMRSRYGAIEYARLYLDGEGLEYWENELPYGWERTRP